jgi:hypothetical protein
VAVDRDGTLNRVGDNDEEWIVEMAVPLAALGYDRVGPGTRIPFGVRRCDVSQKAPPHCGSFGMGDPRGELVLEASSVDGPAAAPAEAQATRGR